MSSISGLNPFLQWDFIPAFAALDPKHLVPAVATCIAHCESTLQKIENAKEGTWEDLIRPLTEAGDALERVWNLASLLHSVMDSETLRNAYQSAQIQIVAWGQRLGQSRALYQHHLRLAQSETDPTRLRILESSLREARLSGVDLEGPQRERLTAINQELAKLQTAFSDAVRDAVRDFSLTLTDPTSVSGLPENTKALLADTARRKKHADATAEKGPWVLDLSQPVYLAVMQHAHDRTLRQRIWTAFTQRSSSGEHDNHERMDAILRLRSERAAILSFPSHAAVSLSRKMAGNVASAEAFLWRLATAAKPTAIHERAELTAFAQKHGGPARLEPWDTPFWAERMREKVLGLDEDILRPYFPLEQVLDGLFTLAKRILGIHCILVTDQKLWHEDARLFQVFDTETGNPLAYLAMDLYARPGVKRDGAWMYYLYGRKGPRLPFAYIACNQNRPVDGKPSLMAPVDIKTLFHEFGHALQHMLTTVEEPAAAGIGNVEWDAVEIASQFWEQWITHSKTLKNLAKHYQTGAPLSDELMQKIINARIFREGFQTVRQLTFALGDLELHHRLRFGIETPLELWRRMATEILDTPPHPDDRMLCSFTHLFSGGYSAGYYSYKWAEALAADLFMAFEESDESQHPALGRKLRDTLFALGGSRHPTEVFKAFRGREPDASALAIRSGFR